jgi:hypothetical protein
MWIMLNKGFISIVNKAKHPADLCVRARRAGEIEAVFPGAQVRAGEGTDYKFRADVPRDQVAAAIAKEIGGIDYTNFKGSVREDARHDAYMGVWHVMMDYQLGRYDRKPARRQSRTGYLRRNVDHSIEYDRVETKRETR